MKNKVLLFTACSLFIAWVTYAHAVDPPAISTSNTAPTFIPQVMLQSWLTYSMAEKKGVKDYANRLDTHFRRLRIGGKGEVYPGIHYNVLFHYDRLGEDPYAATKGSDTGFGLWHAYIHAKPFPETEVLSIYTGYYPAAISREYMTSCGNVSSLDKAYSVWYLRKFLTGRGNGIESGVGLGGLYRLTEKTGLSYTASVHTPSSYISPAYSNPLVTGRVMVTLGDSEQKTHRLSVSNQYWQKRIGCTLGLGCAFQGKSDNELIGSSRIFFDQSLAYGADLMVHYKLLALDGEYFAMKRNAYGINEYNGKEYHVRLACSFLVGNTFVEPAVMLATYNGTGAPAIFKYIGDDTTYDFGVNWHVKKSKFKLGLHYVIQKVSVSTNQGDYLAALLQVKL